MLPVAGRGCVASFHGAQLDARASGNIVIFEVVPTSPYEKLYLTATMRHSLTKVLSTATSSCTTSRCMATAGNSTCIRATCAIGWRPCDRTRLVDTCIEGRETHILTPMYLDPKENLIAFKPYRMANILQELIQCSFDQGYAASCLQRLASH